MKMKATKFVLVIGLLCTALSAGYLAEQTQKNKAEVALQAAIKTETVDGDLRSAIEQYKKIAELPDADRATVATALLRMGQCHEKLGDTHSQEARKAYEQVVREYGDQAEIVKVAQEKLSLLERARALVQKGKQDINIQKVWSGKGVDVTGEVSPDGRFFCFTDWMTGDVAVRDLATGKNRRITDKGPWSKSVAFALFSIWSPDGKSIAYSWFDQDPEGWHFEIRLVGLEDNKPKVLFEHKVTPESDAFPLDWHPDGDHILAYLGRAPNTYELGFLSVSDKNMRVLKEFDVSRSGLSWGFAISPDGRTIAYDRYSDQEPKSRDIFLLSTDGKHEHCLIDHPANDSVCDWTADGRFLLFKSDRTGVPGLWIAQVTDGKVSGIPILLKADMGDFNPMACTAQGQLFYSYTSPGSDIYMAEIDPDSGQFLAPPVKQVRSYEGGNFYPEISPDGKHIVYISSRGYSPRKKYSPCLYSFENDNIRELETGLVTFNQFSYPQWRPDGRAISFGGRDEQNRVGVFQVDLESGKVTTLVLAGEKETIYTHRWAIDGQSIFFTKGERLKSSWIYSQNLKTGQEKKLPGAPEWATDIDLSPDGKWMVYINRLSNSRSLGIIPIEGGDAQELYSFDVPGAFTISPAWSADGKNIFFSSRNNPADTGWDMWRFSLEDRQAQKINNNTVSFFRHPCLHPDGRHIVFSTQNEVPPEVWVIENFLPKTAPKDSQVQNLSGGKR
jgi:Tol biopolymer transport system component